MSTRVSPATLSKSHRLVYDLLQEQGPGRHLAMTELFALARAHRPNIGFTTVYRALVRLRDDGLIAEIAIPGAERAYYEAAATPHSHIRCVVCGRIDDVAYALPAKLAHDLAAARGFAIERSDVSLHGRCAACRT